MFSIKDVPSKTNEILGKEETKFLLMKEKIVIISLSQRIHIFTILRSKD